MNPNYASNMSHHHLNKGYEPLPGHSSQQPQQTFPPNAGNMLPSIGSMVPPPEPYNMASPQARFNMPPNQVNYRPPPAHINYGHPPAQVGYSPPSTQVKYSPPMNQVDYQSPSNQVRYSSPPPTRPTQVNMPPSRAQVNETAPSTPQVNISAVSAQQVTVSPPEAQVNMSPPQAHVNVSPSSAQVNMSPSSTQVNMSPSSAQVNVSPPQTQINASPPPASVNNSLPPIPISISASPPPVNITQSPNEPSVSPVAAASKTSPCQSPTNTLSDPPIEILPNPNQTLAGKLAKSVRRSKRQKPMDTAEITATLIAKLAKPSKPAVERRSKAVADSTSDEQSDCPKEYLNENAYTDRLRFNNDVAKVVYREDFARLGSKEEFQKYLAIQQKWRWDIHNIVKTLETRVHNLTANKNCGIAQNVMRYSSVPINCKSDDVRRCEKTAKELEKMGVRIAETKADIALRKKLLFDDHFIDPAQGELDFLDNMISKVVLLEENVDTCLTNVQDTLQSICRRFTTESVEAAEVRRLKRRKKENIKKKRKSLERQLEKRLIDVLLRLTNKEVAERVLTTSDSGKISVAEINDVVLHQMNTDTEMVALETIISRSYLNEDAIKLVKNKVDAH